MRARALDRAQAMSWLREEGPEKLEELWARADEARARYVGDQVHLRGLLEVSNRCRRRCSYCGIGAFNADIARYRMKVDEVIDGAREAARLGFGTVVMQAGEDPGLDIDKVTRMVEGITEETGLAVTLSLGERSMEELRAWRDAGAARYLLRFETSDVELFERIHPAQPGSANRLETLEALRSMGYEIGSGVMVGIPGQTWESLANDLEIFARLDLDMIGIGPYIPHPATPMWKKSQEEGRPVGDELTTEKMVALARLTCPEANIPSTTALSTLGADARTDCLLRGANVVMPNLTPEKYRTCYEIYPGKGAVEPGTEDMVRRLTEGFRRMGRTPGQGHGSRGSHRT